MCATNNDKQYISEASLIPAGVSASFHVQYQARIWELQTVGRLLEPGDCTDLTKSIIELPLIRRPDSQKLYKTLVDVARAFMDSY